MRPSVARRVTGIAIALAIALAACSFNNGFVLDVTIDGGDRTIALTDANGNVFVAGATDGDLAGTSAGEQDAFLRAYDTDGNPLGTRQFGTDASDVVRSIATDGNGNVYVTGRTDGDLAGPNAGGADAFLRAYGP